MAGIYLHIPFCRKACTYCNFHFSTSLKGKDELLEAMMWELVNRKDYLQGAAVETIYFGGGTPSLLSAEEIKRITDHIYKHYNVRLKECTLEANPDDLDNSYLKSLSSTIVNRFSIGVQSFRDEDLKYMNRAHNAQQADYSIKAAQDAGFTNITIDLIYGTPGLNDNAWKQNLQTFKSLDIPHLSAYALTVEEGTALDAAIKKKKAQPVDAAQSAQQFELLMDFAPGIGLEQYEISNFAKDSMYALHNTNYWRGVPYLGIGPSAHSYNHTSRSWNIANNALYARTILQQKTLLAEEEQLTKEQMVNEYIMTTLRTMWGCDTGLIAKTFGNDYASITLKNSEAFIEKGWMTIKNNVLQLNNDGKLFADRIASEMFL